MTFLEFFSLMGGVGLFLYGMSIMSTGLKNAAGNSLKTILEKATANRFTAVLVGIVVTLLIQSSSATDMMVISFVNSGLMTLAQAIGVIMGANIGTTITAQITAFNLGAYAPVILFVGAVMFLFLKKNTVRHIGSIIMGFGMLFVGISNIKAAIAPLSQSAAFVSFLSSLELPVFAVIFGVLFTAVLQSSSSSVVIFQAFAIEGLLSYKMTVYLVIGAAIGSVMPNILASLTTNRNGKRTAVLNLLFNLIRAAIMILLINLIPGFLGLIQGLTPGDIGRQVANTHTIFALLAVIIEFPFAGAIVKLSQKILPLLPQESKKLEDRKMHYLIHEDEVIPSVAADMARREIARMGQLTLDSLRLAGKVFFAYNREEAESVMETEETVDYLTDTITSKLIGLSAKNLPSEVNHQVSQMMLAASDIERISDHANNLVEYAQQIAEKKAKITEQGLANLKEIFDEAEKAVDMSLRIFEKGEFELLPEIDKQEQKVDDLEVKVINAHVARLMKEACDPMGGVIFADMASDLERCSDHALNIAYALVPQAE